MFGTPSYTLQTYKVMNDLYFQKSLLNLMKSNHLVQRQQQIHLCHLQTVHNLKMWTVTAKSNQHPQQMQEIVCLQFSQI